MKIPGGKKIQLINPQKQRSMMFSVPSHRGMPEKECQRSIKDAVKELASEDWHVFYHYATGANIARNRTQGVLDAQKAGVDYLLFIDDDMVFQADAIKKLVSHDKDIVGGLCVKKTYPYTTTVGFRNEDDQYEMQYDFPLDTLLEVDATGTAFLLIKMSVFDKIQMPWFAFPVVRDMYNAQRLQKFYDDVVDRTSNIKVEDIDDPNNVIDDIIDLAKEVEISDTARVMGEDIYFCRRAQEAGFKMYVDTSVQIGHLGQYPYSIADTLRVVKEQGAPYKSGDIGQIIGA